MRKILITPSFLFFISAINFLWRLVQHFFQQQIINQENPINRWDFTFPSIMLHHVPVKSISEGFGLCSSQAFFIPVFLSKGSLVWSKQVLCISDKWFCISDRRDLLPNLKCWRACQPSSGSGISFYASQNQDAKSFTPDQSHSLCKRIITLASQHFS